MSVAPDNNISVPAEDEKPIRSAWDMAKIPVTLLATAGYVGAFGYVVSAVDDAFRKIYAASIGEGVGAVSLAIITYVSYRSVKALLSGRTLVNIPTSRQG